MSLRKKIQMDQQAAAYQKQLAWWSMMDELGADAFSALHFLVTGYHDPRRLLAAIHERAHFWRDEIYRDRYGV